MNLPLNALLTKLTRQRNESGLELQTTQDQALAVMHELQEVEIRITQSFVPKGNINPEFEISRLSFIIREHEKKESLTSILKDHQMMESKIKDTLLRVNTELKMLEKYLEKKKKDHKEQQKKIAEKALEDWIQHKEQA